MKPILTFVENIVKAVKTLLEQKCGNAGSK